MSEFINETTTETTNSTISEARLAANRANAQKSHGAVTPEGKAKSRLNAVKLGLTGHFVHFANEDEVARYSLHCKSYEIQFQPVGPEEKILVQSIADIRWRLSRIPGIELAILATGSQRVIEALPNFANPEAAMVLELEVRRQHEKELRNLSLTEHRLSRRVEREIARLEQLQAIRKANEEQALAEAAKATLLARHNQKTLAHAPGLGFVFSERKFNTYMSRLTPAQRQKLLQEALAEVVEEPQTMEAAA